MGLETQVGSVRVGVAAGYGDADPEIRDRSSRADFEMIHLAAYAGARTGVFNLRGGMTYSDLDFSTRRTAQVGALSEDLTAEYGGQSWQAFGEAGYGVVIDGATVEPFAGFNGLWLGDDAFQESGGDLALERIEADTRTLLVNRRRQDATSLRDWRTCHAQRGGWLAARLG